MKCSTCGAFVPDDSVFCLECGARVSDTDKTNASDYKTTDISSAGAPTERVSGIPSELETAPQPFDIPSAPETAPQPFGIPSAPETAPQPFGVPSASPPPPSQSSSGSAPAAFSVPEASQTPQPYTPPPPPSANTVPPYNQSGYTTVAIPNSNLAITSLVSSILGWFLLVVLGFLFIGLFIGPIGAIVGVITGHMARKEIRNSDGKLSGDGMAIAGLILGYSQLAIAVLGICAFIGIIFLAVIAAV